MKLKAKSGFTAFDDGRMKVFNPGTEGEIVNETLARQYVEADIAEAVDEEIEVEVETEAAADPLDHDHDGAPGGSLPHDPPALSGMKKAELIAQADLEHVPLEAGWTNAQIIEAIEANRASAGSGEADEAPAE